MSNDFATVLVVTLVALAGCTGGTLPADPGGSNDGDVETGRIDFWVSDERNAIGDFEHLNVTITQVALSGAAANDSAENKSGGWLIEDVDHVTVDLTELQGANASLVDSFDVPAGKYTMVRATVVDVAGVTTAGESVSIKLPSDTVKLNKPFVVAAGSEVEFVFDVTVVEAGNSGRYVLKPVVGESGTDVAIADVDEPESEAMNGTANDSATNETVESQMNGTATVTEGSDGAPDAPGTEASNQSGTEASNVEWLAAPA